MVLISIAMVLVLALLSVGLVALGLPGGWMLLGLATLVELVDGWFLSDPETMTFGWWVLGAGALVLLAGELLELASGWLGSRSGGGTRRGMIGAVAGGLMGVVAGSLLIPIPLVGSLIGSVGGTFMGAMVGELTGDEARDWKGAIWPSVWATIGRLVGLGAKVGVTTVLCIGLSASLFWA